MQLSDAETNEESLARFGSEAAAMMERREFAPLAERFGYALAYDRDPASAIREDFERCLSESKLATSSRGRPASVVVKYFKPNSTGLHAVVECVVAVSPIASVLVELIVTGQPGHRHITLEDVSRIDW